LAVSLRRPRQRSIKTLLAMLFIVPLVSLLALWAFAASVTLISAVREHNYTTENRAYGGAAQALGLQLAQERSQVYVWLSGGRKTPIGKLITQRNATNAAVTSFENGVAAHPGMFPNSARPALARFVAALSTLNTVRAKVDARQISALKAFSVYNAIINSQFQLYDQLVAVNDSSLYQQGIASLQAGRALEMIDREVTLVNGALAAGGHMNKSERLMFAQDVGSQRLLIGDALQQFWPDLAAEYRNVYTSPAYRQFSAIENRIVASVGDGGPVPVTSAQWSPASFSVLAAFDHAEQQDRMLLARAGTRVGDRLLLEVVLAGGLGLVAVALSVLLMVRFGRRISRELTGLQRSALDLASERLPQVVDQLSHGEDVDAAALGPPAVPGRVAEIARVAEAFSSVQQTAVEAAVGQARLRHGVSQVFRNLAWRSQALLHRQLALLDRMERRMSDPSTLEELFRLDHLTTRMRRHAEGLIILSGEAPGRGWRNPVPVVDVLRAAVAEVEDYTRVSVLTRSADALIGTAVADVIHLLAELIENATTNSPRSTEVTVRAERVAHGIVIEVEDRGLGMSDEEIAVANQRLADPPEFDLADSDKLGFFVIARLAARHSIKITLRHSPYGGLGAIVLLPHAITVTDETDMAVEGTFADRLELPPANWLHEAAVAEDTPWESAGQAGDVGPTAVGSGEFATDGEGIFATSSSALLRAADPDGSSTTTDVLFLGGTTGPASTVPAGRDPVTTGPASAQPVSTGPVSTGPVSTEPVSTGPVSTGPVSTEPGSTGPVSAEPAGYGQPDPAQADEPGPDDLLGLPRRVRGAELRAEPGGEEAAPATGSSGLPQRQSLAQREGIPRRDSPLRRGVLPQRGAPDTGAGGQADREPVHRATPEELGSLASSLQRGWLNGRSEADQPADS
jgi:signal transduction histidine kinase